MSEAPQTFGRKLLALQSIEDMCDCEGQSGLDAHFAAIDALVGDLIVSGLQGDRVAKLVPDVRGARASILTLSESRRVEMSETFALDRQQARGAWYLPDNVSLKAGLLNMVAHFRDEPRFALGIASEDRAKVGLKASPDALCLWSSAEPFFEALWLPLELRGALSGTLTREESAEQWKTVDMFLKAMGLVGGEELARFKPGSGWHNVAAEAQTERKGALVRSISVQRSPTLARRFRMYRLHELTERYYAKANSQGQAERRKVISKEYQPTLSGVFAGDWLAFVKYLGEIPHPNEEIATTLPEARLYVTGTTKVAEVASAKNLPVAEVERMVAAFWDQRATTSPVEERVTVLRRYWEAFEQIHGRQKSGMQSLWGLVEERGSLSLGEAQDGLHRSGLYRSLLPEKLVADIDALWAGVTMPSVPERVVTEIFPHAQMAECFGPALRFWHGCALTAWFIAEGPSSRTDIAGLAHYHRKDLADLEDWGCPVDANFFKRLVEVEATLGPPQPIQRQQSSAKVAGGLSVTMTMTVGSRRGGFEKMRDVITRFRSEWTVRHLEKYLHDRWERELRGVADSYNHWLHDKGRPATLKQFAKVAAPAANHWFCGDLSGLYGAIGEKISERPTRGSIIPQDRLGYASAVYALLGGQHFERRVLVQSRDEGQAQANEQQRQNSLKQLANLSLEYLQLEEALGHAPDLKEFGESRFKWHGQALDDDLGNAWNKYADAICSALHSPIAHPGGLPQNPSPRPVVQAPPPRTANTPAASARIPARGDRTETPKPKSWLQRLLGR